MMTSLLKSAAAADIVDCKVTTITVAEGVARRCNYVSSSPTYPAARTPHLTAQGIGTRHALRVRIFAYPEGIQAVWVMVAVYFKPAS